MAAKNKKTATSPVEAPETVEAPDVAPELPAAPVAPLVLPEQVLGFSHLMKLEDMYLEDQVRLDKAMIDLGTRAKENKWSEFETAMNYRDFLADFAGDREAFLELFKGGDARLLAFTLFATWMAELKK